MDESQIPPASSADDDILNPYLEISDMSWADLVNDQFKQEGIERSLSKSNLSKMAEEVKEDGPTVDSILELKHDKIENDLTMLTYQKKVINDTKRSIHSFLKKQSQSDGVLKFDFESLLQKIVWIKDSAKCLSDRIGLPVYTHKKHSGGNIPRSSYRFCNFDYECMYNYSDKHKGCFVQHYVHNRVYADILAVEQYISSRTEDGYSKVSLSEIKKSVDTLFHVTTHMCDELASVERYYKDIRKYHKERTSTSGQSKFGKGRRRPKKNTKKPDSKAKFDKKSHKEDTRDKNK